MNRRLFCSVLFLATSICASTMAQTYPVKPIRIILPVGPGNTSDTYLRFIGQKIAESTGQAVVIDNRPGADGILAMDLGAKAPPDGYTLVSGSGGTHTVNPSMYRKLPYDPIKDFQPLTGIALGGIVYVVRPNHPARNLSDFVAIAKKSPNKLNYGTNTQFQRLSIEMLTQLSSISLVHVPYKTAGPMMTDLLSGQVDLLPGTLTTFGSLIKSGKLRALGISSANRPYGFEEIPTIAEQGSPGFEVYTWIGMFGPAHMPRDLVTRINTLLVKILNSKEAVEYFRKNVMDPMPMTPNELSAFIRRESDAYKKLIRAANLEIN